MDLDQSRRHLCRPAPFKSGLDVDEQIPANIHRRPGLREQQRTVPGAGERPHLRVSR